MINIETLKNTFKITSTLLILGFIFFPALEPQLLLAVDDSITVTQVVTSGISITSPSDVTLTDLTITQNTSVGSAAWTVKTNNYAGYAMTIKASATPALVQVSPALSFADYTEASSGVKETWSVSNAYEFGFSGFGNHTTGHGTDSDCIAGADVPSAGLKWEGFTGTTPIQLASSTSATNQAGTATTLCVATEQVTVFAPSGTYSATLTATASTI